MDKICAIFKLFSLEHFVYMFFAIVVCASMVFVLRKMKNKQKLIRTILVSLMGLFVLLEFVGRIVVLEDFALFNHLPLNAIDVFFVISLIILIKNKSNWVKFCYLIAMPVSCLSIIFIPNFYTTIGASTLSTICFVLANVVFIIFSILNALWSEDDIYNKDAVDAIINFLIIVAVAHIINVFFRFTAWGLQADYFGTMAEGYNMYIGWISALIPVPFVCHLPLMALLVGVVYLLKIPFDVFKTKREHKEQMEELVALGNLKAQQKYRESKNTGGSHILINKKNSDAPKSNNTAPNTTQGSFIKTKREVKTDKQDK